MRGHAGARARRCGSVYREPGPVLARTIADLEEAGERVLALHGQGLDDPAIARRVFGNARFIVMLTARDLSGANLVRSYIEGRRACATTP